MIQLTVVKEQSASGAAVWRIQPAERLCLGAAGSNLVEQMQVTLPEEWAGYTVRLTFHPKGRNPVGIVLPESGVIDITSDITSGEIGRGSFVLDAVQGDSITYTMGGEYMVYTHPAAGGKDPGYTPDEYQQLVEQAQNAIPAGGTTGQVLAKKSDADRDFAWEDQPGREPANPDWNQNDETAPDFVKNRPFYTGAPVLTELIPEQTVSFDVSEGMGQALSPVNADLVEGETYQVMFDGQLYDCVCESIQEGNYYIGNGSVLGLPDTGEPFIYANAEGNYLWLAFSGETNHTLSLASKTREIVQMPVKYLPSATDEECGVVKRSEFVPYVRFDSTPIELSKIAALPIGTIVCWKSTVYILLQISDNFVVMYDVDNNVGKVFTADSEGIIYSTMNWDYNYATEIHLKSHDIGSNKKFTIMVDDTGTLSVMEDT